MNQIEEADKIITSKSIFGNDYEKAISIYQKILPFVSDNEKIFLFQKLIFCYQQIHCNYDVANCYYQIALLSRKLNYEETEDLYKHTILLYLEIDTSLAAKYSVELAEYLEPSKKAIEHYKFAAELFLKKSSRKYYNYMMKCGDLSEPKEAIEYYQKILFFCDELDLNFVKLKLYVCKKVLNLEFEMEKTFLQSKEFQVYKNKIPIDDWFEKMFSKIEK